MVDQQTRNPEEDAQTPSPESLFEQARTAHKKGQRPQARRLYNEIVQRFKDDKETQDTVEQARAFNALLDREVPAQEMGPLSTTFAIIIGFGVWIFIGFGIAAIFSHGMRDWWSANWVKMVLGSIGLIVFLVVAILVEKKLAVQSEGRRRMIVAFIVVPLIALTMMAAIAFGASRMALAMELVLILVASLMPAAAYYLFLATRRPSILNEFIGNLSRLGLLLRRPTQRTSVGDKEIHPEQLYESYDERRARIESYFQRFEAIYGVLRFETEDLSDLSRTEFVNRLILSVDRNDPDFRMPQATVHVTDIFRANLVIPIGLVTILATLGWLLVMQPDLKSVIKMPEKNVSQATNVGKSAQSGPEPSSDATPQKAGAGTARSTEEDATKAQPNDKEGTSAHLKPTSPATPQVASGGKAAGLIAHLTPTWTPVSFAFLGAYFFGIQMLFRRFVRRDLGPNAYLAFSNRIIVAVIGIWVAIAAYAFMVDLANEASGPQLRSIMLAPIDKPVDWPLEFLVVAFVIGVFPRMLWQFIGAAFSKMKLVKAVIPTIEAKQPLSELDGLTIWHESRLEEEDVENVPNMATVDVVDIMLHTQIPAERLISWIDQAILYSVLGPKGAGNAEASPRNKLRALGLRSATQVVAVFHGDTHLKKALASVLGQDSMHAVVLAIKLEGNYDRVSSWRRVSELAAVSPSA
jgi:hypothetical protein